jgi:hypothetical protein
MIRFLVYLPMLFFLAAGALAFHFTGGLFKGRTKTASVDPYVAGINQEVNWIEAEHDRILAQVKDQRELLEKEQVDLDTLSGEEDMRNVVAEFRSRVLGLKDKEGEMLELNDLFHGGLAGLKQRLDQMPVYEPPDPRTVEENRQKLAKILAVQSELVQRARDYTAASKEAADAMSEKLRDTSTPFPSQYEQAQENLGDRMEELASRQQNLSQIIQSRKDAMMMNQAALKERMAENTQRMHDQAERNKIRMDQIRQTVEDQKQRLRDRMSDAHR